MELEARSADLSRLIEIEKALNSKIERSEIIYWISKFKGGNLESQEFRRKVIDTFVTVVYLTDDDIKIGFNYSGKNNFATFSFDWSDLPETSEGSYKLSDGLPKNDRYHRVSVIFY